MKQTLRYIPPGQRKAQHIDLSLREMDLVEALRKGPATRLELLDRGRPRLALNANTTISQIRRKGLFISDEWQQGVDAEGMTVRFKRYALRGRVVGVKA